MKTQARRATQKPIEAGTDTTHQPEDVVDPAQTDGRSGAVALPEGGITADGRASSELDPAADSGQVLLQSHQHPPSSESLLVGTGATTIVRRATRGIALPSLDDNVGRILLSIVLALLLWFYVTSLENPEQTTIFRGLSVDVRGTGANLKIINSIPTVDTEVRAPQDVMGRLRQSDVRPYIDLSSLDEGVHRVTVHAEMAGSQMRSVTVDLSPRIVQVQLEAQVTRQFTVTAQVTGTPAFGHGVDPAQLKQDRVTVTGGKEAVSRIAKVVVVADIEQKAATERGLKSPVALDSAGREIKDVTFTPASLEVTVPIKLLFNYKVVQVRVPVEGQPAPGFRVSDIQNDPRDVTICCSPSLLEPLRVLDTAPVSVASMTSTIITSTELLLPPGVELYPGQTTKVNVTISIEAVTTTLKLSVAPTVIGLQQGISAVVSPNRLDLTLAGTFADVQALNPAQVFATLNVQGRQAGTYDIQPEITLPQGIRLVQLSPQRVAVTLIAPTAVPRTPTPVPSATPTRPAPPTPVGPVVTTVVSPTPTRGTIAVPTSSPGATPSATPSPPVQPSPPPPSPPSTPTVQPTATPTIPPQGIVQTPDTTTP